MIDIIFKAGPVVSVAQPIGLPDQEPEPPLEALAEESEPTNLDASPPPPEPKAVTVTSNPAETEADPKGAESSDGGAFNPATGEINWDCPCLGGMAHGPCGPQFREAFSCFVFSQEEPKGIDCVKKFQAMQACFREHPDIYADGVSLDGRNAFNLSLTKRYRA